MPTPHVSVVLPAHDAAETLHECLESIAGQSESRFECLIVDDGSTDATLQIASEFGRRDPRFRAVSIPHQGVAKACNLAIAEAVAPVIARMDADDRMHPQRLAVQLATLRSSPTLSVVATWVRYFPRDALGPGMRDYESWLNSIASPRQVREAAFIECPLANPTLLWRRDRIPGLRYREGLDWPEDYDLVLRLLSERVSLAVVPQVLHEWRQHPKRLTRTDPIYRDERFIECKAHYLARGFLKRHSGYHLWGYGRTGRLLSKALLRENKHPASIVELHPGRIGQRIRGAPVIPHAALGPPDGVPLLVCVAGSAARERIARELDRRGWRSGVDTLFAA